MTNERGKWYRVKDLLLGYSIVHCSNRVMASLKGARSREVGVLRATSLVVARVSAKSICAWKIYIKLSITNVFFTKTCSYKHVNFVTFFIE